MPSARRRAREEADVPRAGELTAAAAFAVVTLALIVGGAYVAARLAGFVRAGLTAATTGGPDLPAELRGAAFELLRLSAPLLGAAALAALAVGLAQTGGLFTLRPGRFGLRRGSGGALRVAVGAAVLAVVVVPELGNLGRLTSAPALAAFLGDVVARLLAFGVVGVALCGAADLYRARRRFLERMRASRQEERAAEGDPRLRRRTL